MRSTSLRSAGPRRAGCGLGLGPAWLVLLVAAALGGAALLAAQVLRGSAAAAGCEQRASLAEAGRAALAHDLDAALARAAAAEAQGLAAARSAEAAQAAAAQARAAGAAARVSLMSERADREAQQAQQAQQAQAQAEAAAAAERRPPQRGPARAAGGAAAAEAPPRVPLAPFPLAPGAAAAAAAAVAGGGAEEGAVEPAPASPRAARALLVICYNRPDYLRRTLQAVSDRLPRYNRPHVYVSQDGEDAGVAAVAADFAQVFARRHPDVPFAHLRHPPGALRGAPKAWETGYFKLAQHFGWALGELFARGHPRVIVLEDDIEVAPDFFDFFSATEPLLDADRTLLAASAYADTGQAAFVDDARQLLRSDFFPGLGWMLTRHAWEELGPKWPEAYWDDWLREPPNRRARQFLRPEVSRAVTFGEAGTSNGAFFAQFLGNVRLNAQPVDWGAEDTSYLERETFAADLRRALAGAREVVGLADFVAAQCAPGGGGGGAGGGEDLKHAYEGTGGYASVASAFGFISDLKAGVPRTGYAGAVIVKHSGCRKFIYASTRLDENNALPH
jgi:alpha-1,3-mannosyl-glycoprotein beta-1,2-N-acetylglucosaminyltransferase